ncbi:MULTISPECIES: BCCT family transporter [unclassified Rathayibacter]|uniref:BCCT family transporter n=1 Tax=unclassified Rathayibacter TaxID=2609250 RepID=UPI001050729A|nr:MULTISPECIES: BCCT family transporter [unclassified Rathayibacter]MCJ1703115.1 BCCT family transporter [Rathayibacter sp. VKM Ac-2926]TCL82173.1 choline/glycine/proline betaine transport protein [Rathayibacter sp. PhB192]TCM27389.1 choline/glycine/proline betaine transport protein [Rathayibacter sp. PhB179]
MSDKPSAPDIAVPPAADTTARPPQRLARWVFWPAAVITLSIAAFAIIAPDAATSVFASLQTTVVNTFSWYYVLIAAVFVAFAIWMGVSRFGDIKLGADDDEPEFSMLSWISLLFAAGMGIGLVFYGVAEPLTHFATPRPGVTGTETELAQSAISQTYLHWGVHAWSIYVVVGLALAYAIHRRKRPVSIRWALEPLLGRRVRGGWGNAIDVVALVGTMFGVATSLGLGVTQISAGLEASGIVDSSLTVQIIVIAVVTALTVFSLVSGVGKGMKWLSTGNLLLAAALLVFVLVAGPTQFLLREFVQSLGNYLQNFIGLTFTVSAYAGQEGEAWQATWTTFYWGWWMSWAPFVGIFIARVSKGRTVREFVAGVLLVPTIMTFLWFSVLGGTALYRELYGDGGLVGADGSVSTDAALFSMLQGLPAGSVLTVGAIILIGIFFVTSADSGALVMSMIATGGDAEPRNRIRIFFALATALLALSLLIAGGLDALQTAAILSALPFSVVMILMCVATVIAFRREIRAYDKARRAAFVGDIGSFYGLEVEEPLEREPAHPLKRLAQRIKPGPTPRE